MSHHGIEYKERREVFAIVDTHAGLIQAASIINDDDKLLEILKKDCGCPNLDWSGLEYVHISDAITV